MQTGVRERRKAEKLDAIRKAARHLFETHGFHETPLREVARVADVGFGTVSAYACDKAGLAAMLFVEDLEQLAPVFVTIDTSKPLLDQVIENFSLTFRFWASKPELSRVILPMLGNTENTYLEYILDRRAALRAALIAWLYRFKQVGKISSHRNLEQAAELLFALYMASINEWLSAGETAVDSGIARMRYLMEIPVDALTR